jgi:hypothetical protein
MSRFDAVYKKIEEQLPVTPQQQQQAAGVQTNPANAAVATNQAQQKQAAVDPKIMQELIAAKNEQQVQLALQKLQAAQQAQQKTGTQQPAV